MEDRISAVQQALLLLLVAAFAFLLLGFPHPDNAKFTAALQEVISFRASFQREATEQLLRVRAEAQGLVPLASVAAASEGPHVPALRLDDSAPPLRPLTKIELSTLGQVFQYAQPNAKTSIGVPDVKALGAGLAWRLARLGGEQPLVLKSVALVPAEIDEDDLKLERETAELRLLPEKAQAAVEAAQKKLDQESRVLEARRKLRASWKMVLKSMEAVKEATETLEARKQALSAAAQDYEDHARRAQQARKPTRPRAVPSYALAQVTLSKGASEITLSIPVKLAVADVPVPSLTGASFSATHFADLWGEVKDSDADAAIAAIRDHFNWHNRIWNVLGMQLSGALLLQILPLSLPFLLWLLMARMRRVSKSYSPFSTKVPETLPRVGFKRRGFDLLVVVVLPFAAAACSAVSLHLVGQPPVLAAATALICLALGTMAFMRLGELKDMVESVVHSHSYPPSQA
jgi:hypothetical protein